MKGGGPAGPDTCKSFRASIILQTLSAKTITSLKDEKHFIEQQLKLI